MENYMGNILVMGVGNDLLRDEGVGVHVIRAMREMSLPDNVSLCDGGVAGIDLLEEIRTADRLIIVDAMDAGDRPGSVFRFSPDEVSMILNGHKTSLHQVDLFDTLKIARFLECCPETIIIGVQPRDITWGMELTPDLSERVPEIINLVCDEIARKE